jgi:hypothetical protein
MQHCYTQFLHDCVTLRVRATFLDHHLNVVLQGMHLQLRDGIEI